MTMQTFKEAYENAGEPLCIMRSGNRLFEGFCAGIQIDRKTVPNGWHVYDICGEKYSENLFDELKNGYVMVNYMGTFATKEDIGLAEGESLYYSDNDNLGEDEFCYSF